ncbi:response regulator [Myxococcaceae bacterium JPH2]|nr:response regulator [Myxococcaceae bacterium JPH2]
MPASEVVTLERGLRETETGRGCRVLCVDAPPDSVPDGLVVLWDAGGPLETLVARCRHLHAHRAPLRTHLVVLTSRGDSDAEALALAGADECARPPGSAWGARLVALRRRLEADGGEDLQTLRRTVAFLRNALDAVPDPLFVKDRAHRWVAMNSAFCRFMGHEASALLGHSDYEFVPAHEAEVFWRQDERVFRTRQGDENEELLTDSAGHSRCLVTKKAAFTSEEGEPFLVAVIRDVTDRKRLEHQLRLAERMASVGTLAAGVAHEINNPLAYVTSNLSYLWERLAQPALPAEHLGELRQVVAEALEGAGRVRTIVRDLRTFSRTDEEHHGPVNVHSAVEGALRLVRNEMQHRARLVCSLEPVLAVHGNEGRLVQVLVNLLVNALQAFPERPAEENRIRVSARPGRSGYVMLEVEDNGRGMTPEVKDRIFDPFFTTKPTGVGTGLGLSICLTIVQAMAGRIDVLSTPGRGSAFRVELPALSAHVSAPVGPRLAGMSLPGDRRRLLLIDDEPSVGSSVSRLLRDLYDVHVFQDAREALQRLSHGERFDAILCDLMMPGMSGMDFLVELERLAPELAPHTGLMTGGAFTAQAREFVGHRARELLEKPFERERLCTFVEHLMQ